MSDLVERLRRSAKAFRENPIYDSEGDAAYLTSQAGECDEAASQIEAQQAEMARLREALEWYGEQARLCRLIHSEGDAGRQALSDDGGKLARAALEQKP